MYWFQAAFDPEAVHGKQWVVLQMNYMPSGGYIRPMEVSRWPTKHEAEGRARKEWESIR
jgi:hypothetical protein